MEIVKGKAECQCEYCIKCKCGHRADEHLAGIGSCFKCNCPEHSDKSWMERGNKNVSTKLH